jgi:hypothetical protein
VLTGSPFGVHLLGGRLPLFDPYGWDDRGIDDAIALLGWTCRRHGADDGEQALAMLAEAVRTGPVLAGPLEMGLLRHVPGMTGPIGSDHYVAVLEADDTLVRFHDPHGCPYATLPTRDFLAAWRADTITFYPAVPYTMRRDFRQVRETTAEAALRAALPARSPGCAGVTTSPCRPAPSAAPPPCTASPTWSPTDSTPRRAIT